MMIPQSCYDLCNVSNYVNYRLSSKITICPKTMEVFSLRTKIYYHSDRLRRVFQGTLSRIIIKCLITYNDIVILCKFSTHKMKSNTNYRNKIKLTDLLTSLYRCMTMFYLSISKKTL